MEKSEANDRIFHTTGLGKLPHTILTEAADDRRGRSDSGIDPVEGDPLNQAPMFMMAEDWNPALLSQRELLSPDGADSNQAAR